MALDSKNMFSNAATIVVEIENDVFCGKFLLSRERRRSFRAPKGGRSCLCQTGSHDVVSRKVLNGLTWLNTVFDTRVLCTLFSKTLAPLVIKNWQQGS